MAPCLLLVSLLLFIDINESSRSEIPSTTEKCNQSLVNTNQSTQTPTLTLESLISNVSTLITITTNPTNNISSFLANSSEDNPFESNQDSSSNLPQSRKVTLFTLIGTAIFITAVILIIRAKYGLCKTRMKAKLKLELKSDSNQINSRPQSKSAPNIAPRPKPHLQHNVSTHSQHGVAADGSDGSGTGDAGQGTPQSHPSANGLGQFEIRLSFADSVNKVYHKSPKSPDSMKRKITEYIQRELHDNEIHNYKSRLSVASAASAASSNGHGWRIPFGNAHNHKTSMEEQISASKHGEHTHTKSKSMEIGYAETIHLGQKINKVNEDEEIDIFDAREPGSPCPSPSKLHKNRNHGHHSMNQNVIEYQPQNSIIRIPSPPKPKKRVRTTNGIADDEFVVGDGESSHDIVTLGEDYETPGHESNDSDIAGGDNGDNGDDENKDNNDDDNASHDSDNDIILDMDMNTKGFIE